MGVPIQELWLDKNKHLFKSVKIGVAGGAILDFLSERISRAPKNNENFKVRVDV